MKHEAKVSKRQLKCVVNPKHVHYKVSLQHQKHLRRIPPVISVQVNAVDHLGQTALHRAARCGHLQTCRLLLTTGCDPLLTSLQGLSPSQLGNESVQEILQGDRNHYACF